MDEAEDEEVKLEDVTNGLPSRKTLRNDDPNYKNAETLRCVAGLLAGMSRACEM